jgi:uncharacterized protein (TIGR03066 family)
MKLLQLALVGCLVLGTSAASRAEDTKGEKKEAPNKDKLVGTWEVVKAESEKGPPPGMTVHFTKDGKATLSFKAGDKTISAEGTYKVEGDKLAITLKIGPGGKDHTDTDTIVKLTDKQLIIKDSNTNKNVEFKKVKK